jgi:acyl dehydratase
VPYGRCYDELEVGQHFKHWPGRTITEFDDTWFSLMSMNQHPLHIDEHYASSTQHGQRLVEGPLVIALVIGMSQADIGGMSLRVIEYAGVRHLAPVFHGDTIYAESVIVAKEEGNRVTVESKGLNQRGEAVLVFRRTIELPSKRDTFATDRRPSQADA